MLGILLQVGVKPGLSLFVWPKHQVTGLGEGEMSVIPKFSMQ